MNDHRSYRRRTLIKGSLAASAGMFLGDRVSPADTSDALPNAITIENAKSGSRDWQLTRVRTEPRGGIRCPAIEGYCSRQSVSAGESIDLFVSTDPASDFQIP